MAVKIQIKDFNLEATLDSGQVFGFTKSPQNVYSGRIGNEKMELWQEGKELHFKTQSSSARQVVLDYFDLERNLDGIYKILQQDAALLPSYHAIKGLRLIRQNSWEALACFIISSNNNVKRIQGIWRNLSLYFNKEDSGFPSAMQIAKSHERILRQLGLGYRAPFLQKTAQFVSANPACLEAIREAPYEEARERVMCFPGIGPKVADCVLLYGFGKFEAFPVDVWILRIVRKLYFHNRKISEKRVRVFGQKKWGCDAGYVQQYLFHGARMGIL